LLLFLFRGQQTFLSRINEIPPERERKKEKEKEREREREKGKRELRLRVDVDVDLIPASHCLAGIARAKPQSDSDGHKLM